MHPYIVLETLLLEILRINAPYQGRIQDFRKGGSKHYSVRAKFLDTPTNRLTTPPNCRHREAVGCFLTVKCSISTKFGTIGGEITMHDAAVT